MEIVRRCQPWENFSDPDPRFANDLHAKIADLLGLGDYKILKFYTAVGSHLDKFHGIDAFFEYDCGDKTITITLDVTINPRKGEEYKADVVFYFPADGLDPKIDKKEYLEKIGKVAQSVVEEINLKSRGN